MTLKFNNVYINETSLVVGPFVKDGPLKNFDKVYNDFYNGEKTFEECEIKALNDCLIILLEKINKNEKQIDVVFSSDLSNQLSISNIVLSKYNIPYFGVYNACSSLTEMIILSSSMIESKKINNSILLTSSHNLTAERQYRNPVEYGAPKPKYSTFTVTSSTGCYISNTKSKIKIDTCTIGKVIDSTIKDVSNMGAVMAIAAANTLFQHLNEIKKDSNYYDLILTGDLGKYGKKIFIDTLKELYNIELNNYEDTACIIYDNDDKNTLAGGSGISCMPTVLYSKIIPEMKNEKIKNVLLLATGALMNPTTVNLKKSIPSISHAVSLKVIR